MEDPEQALAYSTADFGPAHDSVVDLLLQRCPDAGSTLHRVVDLGCGPADVTARLALALPGARVDGLDAGPRMLEHGRQRLARLGLDGRVELHRVHLPADSRALDRFGPADLVASNSLLHHLSDPAALWRAVVALGRPGTVVHVVDLRRPADDETVERLVDANAADEPEVLKDDFRRSLRAAYRPSEVTAQLTAAGLDDQLTVEVVSEHHLLVHGRLGPSRAGAPDDGTPTPAARRR